jgi:Kef-type K+ transport system membrane component KefB
MLTDIEAIIFLLLLLMGVPDLCAMLGRPALAYPVFALIGLAIAPFVEEDAQTMLTGAGAVGFVLLLFEVGSEIELPRPSVVRHKSCNV